MFKSILNRSIVLSIGWTKHNVGNCYPKLRNRNETITKSSGIVRHDASRTLNKIESDDRCPGRVNSSCCDHAPAD